jgi:hypothetical protein
MTDSMTPSLAAAHGHHTMIVDDNLIMTGSVLASARTPLAAPLACWYRMVLDNVKDYRFVRIYPAKTGVNSSQSGNSSGSVANFVVAPFREPAVAGHCASPRLAIPGQIAGRQPDTG